MRVAFAVWRSKDESSLDEGVSVENLGVVAEWGGKEFDRASGH